MTLSMALRHGASTLHSERTELRFRFLDAHQDWRGLSLGGPAGDAARTSLAGYDWLAQPLHQMEQVATTERHASLQARREELEDRIIAFLDK